MKLSDSEALLLEIVRKSLFDIRMSPDTLRKENADWEPIFREACRHNVLPLVLQSISGLKEELKIPEDKIEKWRITAYNQVAYNEKVMFYQNMIVEILDKARIPYAVLKGSGLGACYPHPFLRVLQDIDLLLRPSDLERAAEILSGHGFKRRKACGHFHEVLDRGNITVEPHIAVSYINPDKTGEKIRAFFEDALESAETESSGAYSFKVLSARHQAMALLLHMERHIAENKLDLRRLCDWAMFVSRKTTNEMWKSEIEPALIRCGLNKFAMLVTKICVIYLGLDIEHCRWAEAANDRLCGKLLAIILRNYDHGAKQPSIVVQSALRDERELPKLLVPFVYVFKLLRYLYRMSTGKRPKIYVRKTICESIKMGSIYRKLGLYKAGKT